MMADTHAADTSRERIDRYLTETGRSAGAATVALTPDASDRRYFRVTPSDGQPFVLALHAGPIDFASLPFANVAALLEQVPLPIPHVLGHDDATGIVAQSDLGDVTLQAHLTTVGDDEQRVLYEEAIGLIALMQARGADLASDRYLPYRLAFDVDKLTWEMHFFVTHFLEAYRGITLTVSERVALDAEWRSMVEELAAERRVLCHRDYHSRNLMLHQGRLHIIDFQDARLGPDTYDLVSLLRDSYVELPEPLVEVLIERFVALRREVTTPLPEFRRRFDLMAVQRNLKALGTFGFQATTRNNPVYAQYVPRTLQYVQRNLATYPRFERLRTLLGAHVNELR